LTSFYDRPILNSPYRAPELHHPLDDNGQPLEGEPRPGREEQLALTLEKHPRVLAYAKTRQ